jgi:hypothetical protein
MEALSQETITNRSEESDDVGKDVGEMAVSIIFFSGKLEEFPFWIAKRKARAKKKNHKGHLMRTVGEILESDFAIQPFVYQLMP